MARSAVPQLARVTSFTRTALISGAIWILWHLPILLFADVNAGTQSWFALVCFAALAIGISFAFAWLRLASSSIWTGVVLHASHNPFIQGVSDGLALDTGFTAYGTGEFGIGLALRGLMVGYAFWRGRSSLLPRRGTTTAPA